MVFISLAKCELILVMNQLLRSREGLKATPFSMVF